jgi:hypothetical protein
MVCVAHLKLTLWWLVCHMSPRSGPAPQVAYQCASNRSLTLNLARVNTPIAGDRSAHLQQVAWPKYLLQSLDQACKQTVNTTIDHFRRFDLCRSFRSQLVHAEKGAVGIRGIQTKNTYNPTQPILHMLYHMLLQLRHWSPDSVRVTLLLSCDHCTRCFAGHCVILQL